MSDQHTIQPDDNSPEGRQRVVLLLHEMLQMHVDDVDCVTCGDKMDCLAELVAAGSNPKHALPAIYNHLKCCRSCTEEFEALVAVLLAEQAGKLDELK
ncbi:MAG: hypothetical protein KF716_27235 [Anaerolineae bacterium]|nr:hypothetical protein [Anaerolineae bacterium]